ncbi:aspartyl-phosphate phosphatase Spo0E family protein [Clostridium chromiireducens]|uniref:Aspartyl-phosphate phosphatase Spo0E family protein n=1 Tax=Clostridium chromiireducens TaxID=225345 RepID=A0A399IXL1_9CLOT|nr:aspartyl-phosphate phosphatase Spo0E family protein [Clostridium chromiireducens]RII35496.1 aspartyl-phosphate phosphatase Spo0E family protein [Clostridium chromiireducens]
MTNLENNIENLRNELYKLLDANKLTNIKIVTISQRLDELIVEYSKYKL